jgi:superfamily II DNA/RNA helicase
MKAGCDILVSTPGRLIDFLERKLVTLKEIRHLIMDEADKMLEMGFEDQLNKIIFDFNLPPKLKRQNLMFSATFTDQVKSLAKNFMNECFFVSTYKQENSNENIKHIIIYSTEDQKVYKLHVILQQIKGKVIGKSI